MKQIVFSLSLLLGLVLVASCSMEDKGSASATVSYMGELDSISFSVAADTIYEPYITEIVASKDLALSGSESLFSKSAKVNENSSGYAVQLCDEQAVEAYQNLINLSSSNRYLVTLMKKEYGDVVDFDKLSTFTVYYSLYGMTSSIEGYTQIQQFKVVY